MRDLHARLHIDRCLSLLHLNRAAIKTYNLLFVVDGLAGAVIKLLESDINCHIDVLGRFGGRLVETSVCSAEIATLDLEIGSCNLSKVGAEIEEWVGL